MNIIATSEITPAIRKWKPYPGYKHSGVAWLGTIPEHWNVSTLKLLAPTVQRGKSPDYVEEGGIPVINQACVYWEGLRLENIKYDSGKDGDDGKGRLLPGDVLVNSTGTGTLGRASVFRHEETHLADGHVTVVRVDQTAELPEYFFYLLQTPIYQGFIYAALVSGSTNQIELSRESFRATPTIVPPINEQARIVRFLDRETAKIDELVAKKERLIELLQEKRSALITRAVTKGLDPNVPMKDSGVEWLGEIPAHWEVKQIRNIAKSLQTGPFGSQLHSGDYTPGGIPVINPSHLRDGCIVPALDCAVDEATASRLRQHELYEGDIIFARRGEMGRCALVTKVEAGWLCGTGSLRIRPNLDLVYPAFLNTFLSTSGIREWLLLEAVGATMDNLNTTILGRLPVLVPTIDDQRAVSTFCDSEATKINALIAKVREGIEKLKEYRTALISAAVTGKIDVRDEISGRSADSPERNGASIE